MVQLLAVNTKKKYLVLEYGEETLADFIKASLLLDNERKAIIEKLVKSLQEVHDKGTIHGDVKPQNIMRFGR